MSLCGNSVGCCLGPTFLVGNPPGLTTLSGLLWQLPCTSVISAFECGCGPGPPDQIATLSGVSGKTYNVTMLIRGLMENNEYTGGTVIQPDAGTVFQVFTASGIIGGALSQIYQGGSPVGGSFYNIYYISISNPPQLYRLNSYVSGSPASWGPVYGIRYTMTIPIMTGAVVTLHCDSGGDDAEVSNGPGATPVVMNVLSGEPPLNFAQSPYYNSYGQVCQIDVLKIA